jgi:putative membrane protein
MLSILFTWLVITVAILVAAYVLPGIKVYDLKTAVIAAAVLGLINAFVRPVLVFLTLPITVITLGLFLLVLNALLLLLTAKLVSGLRIDSFWWAIAGSIVISIVTWAADHLRL